MFRLARMKAGILQRNNKIQVKIKRKKIILIMCMEKIVMNIMICKNKVVINIIKLIVKNIMIYYSNNKNKK